jgi:FKBP-type peptidyl-prolyl cis-trans isomerase 2
MAEAIKEGNLVYLAFDGWIENPGSDPQLFDTTDEDRAKEADLFNEKRTYGEFPFIVGSGRLPEGLEQAILNAKVGEEKEVIIPPAQGMGERDPKLVELLPLREFRRREIEPQQGMEVQVRNRMGTVTAVTAGRVRVDFNNPLAGRTLRYKFKVLKKVKAAKAKVKAIIEMDYGSADDFQIKVEKGKASIILPDASKVDEAWFVNKFRVVSDLREHAGLKTIQFLEEYTTPKEEAPTEEETSEA